MIWPIRFGGWCGKAASKAEGSDLTYGSHTPRGEEAHDALRSQRMHMRHDIQADAERLGLHSQAERGEDQSDPTNA